MDIIDFRLRPPSHGFLTWRIFTEDRIRWFASQLRVPPSEAAITHSMEQFWAEVEAAGITLGVMNGRQCPDPIGFVSNDDIADLQRLHAGKLIGVGAVRLGRLDTLVEVDRCIKELGLRGISVDPGLDDPPRLACSAEVQEVARRCATLGVPLLVTLSAVAGPDVSYSDPVHVDRLAAACPDTTIVVAHACWPFAQAMCGVAFRRNNVYVSPDMYMMRCPGVMDYVLAANTFLEDRFLFASAFPSCPLKPLIDYYATLPFEDRVRRKIMFENAVRLLNV